jgi:hypothetical protein
VDEGEVCVEVEENTVVADTVCVVADHCCRLKMSRLSNLDWMDVIYCLGRQVGNFERECG